MEVFAEELSVGGMVEHVVQHVRELRPQDGLAISKRNSYLQMKNDRKHISIGCNAM